MAHLLDQAYRPDTLDLNKLDQGAKTYWYECFKDLIGKLAKQAARSSGTEDGAERAEKMRGHFVQQLTQLQLNIDDSLTIRQYLELHEDSLRLFGFSDPWREQKSIENSFAIKRFRQRTEEIDKLEGDDRWIEICKGLLAGNMFDWGAQVISDILEADKNFGLPEALTYIQKRPWVIDDLDPWLERLKGPAHQAAAIFVDNSGVDVVLGVLPFARELLRRGTKVILCANSGPALNDITSDELVAVIEASCKECAIFKDAWTSGRLRVLPNGHSSPCLDLRQLPDELAEALHDVDLIMIEGMGRALHTNLNARLKCETVKAVVIKNKWLAKNLFDGDIFSVIFKYETPATFA